ncbi:MAG TPA: hypothetical protein VHZ33_16110, partial [Trebonia sp.]|nr:hypothetical protein [Trebonia sp.]
MTTLSGDLEGDAVKALEMLVGARASGRPCPPVRDLLPAGDAGAAYAVQARWAADQVAAGARVIGRKIGLTNPVVQAQFGVDRPDFGVLFDSMACAQGTPIDGALTLQPKIEAEIAFVLAEDLTGTMIGPAEVAAATAYVVAARASGQPCPPIRGLLPAEDVDAAYTVQASWVDDQIAAGARVVGRKIGLTNPAVQAQFGVDRPDFGVLFDSMACAPGTPIDGARTLQPKIEAEIAFVLAEDLTGAMIGPAEVAAATAYVVAALEIVDSRI